MEILDVKYGGNFVFNKEKTNYHPKATQDQDGFKTATVEMRFKIKDIKASAWRSKANIHIHVTDVDTGGDFSVLFDLDSNFGEYWQLIVTMQYFNFMVDDEEIKEDKSYYYKIEGETFTQVENFDEDYYDDEDEE